ncbi:MAG: dihydroorotase family protein [Actinobacteria bacterium]|nr:dihydroorotase family protein [Actinomycetota bacterium]
MAVLSGPRHLDGSLGAAAGSDQPGSGEPADLVIANGRLVLPTGVVEASVAVRAGRIERIQPAGSNLPARRLLDARGRHVMPGLIDSHVHFRTPGLTHKEDWRHGSRAAVAGGVTTVIDMPNTVPPLFDPARAAAKAALIEGSSLVDFRFHLGVDPQRPDLLDTVTPREAVSAKVFMAGHHTAPHVVRDAAQLERIFRIAARSGLRLVLHAEDDRVFALLDRWRPGPSSYADYEPMRPRSGGIVAAATVIDLVERAGTATHVLHVSSAEEADLYAAAAASGLPITFEVTGHHLSFSDHDMLRLGSRIRLSPAIRQPADRERLWTAVFSGQAGTLGSDHAPHLQAEKCRPPAEAPPGLPGIQELASAVFTGMRRRRPDQPVDEQVALLARLGATAPADLFGLGGRKGRIEVGGDADFVIFDSRATWSLGASRVQSKCGWSAYEGWLFTGRADLTIRAGEVVHDAATGEFGAPSGRWLAAEPMAGPVPVPAGGGRPPDRVGVRR